MLLVTRAAQGYERVGRVSSAEGWPSGSTLRGVADDGDVLVTSYGQTRRVFSNVNSKRDPRWRERAQPSR